MPTKSATPIVYRKLSDLVKLAHNPRTIKKEDMEKLMASIKKFGVLEGRPFLLSNRTGELVIIGGNMRYEACKKLKIDEVPTSLITKEMLEEIVEKHFEETGEKITIEGAEKEIIIRDNVSNGEWDMEMLANEWADQPLGDWGLKADIPMMAEEEKELIEDNVPEEPKAIYVQEGDIFQLGQHTLMCGDSMKESDIQKLLQNAPKKKTHCISDPPYGIAYDNSKSGGHGMIKNDDVILDYTALGKKYSNGFFCMWTGYQVLDDWMQLVRATFDKITNLIIWHKGGGGMGDCARTLAQDYEILIVTNRGNEIQGYRGGAVWMWNQEEKEEFMKRASKEMLIQVLTKLSEGNAIWKVGKDDVSSYMHPTQKPVEINQRVLENFTAQGDNVLDLFGGSGSNLIACEKTNRRCFMMELDPKYAQVIIKRFYEYTEGMENVQCLNRDIDMALITEN